MYANFRHFGDEDRSIDRIYHSELRDIGAEDSASIVLSPGLSSTPQRLAVTSTVVAGQMSGIPVLFTGGGFRALLEGAVAGTAQRIHAVGDFAFWEDWGSTVRIAFGSLDRAPRFLRDIAPGRIRAFHTDGVDFAWVEIRDDPPTLELFTAPVVFDAAELEPRRVGPIEGIQFTGMGGGWFVRVLADPERIELTELATGRTKTWHAAEGEILSGFPPTYVAATEILLKGRRAGGTNYWIRLDPRVLPWE